MSRALAFFTLLFLVVAPTLALAACPGGICVVTTGSNAITNGTNFKTALTTSVCGDIIELQAFGVNGFSYQAANQGDVFILENKGDCSLNPITIRTSAYASLPTTPTLCTDYGYAEKTVLCPSRDAPLLAKLVADQAVLIQARVLAKGWTLIGLNVTDAAIVRDFGFGPKPTYTTLFIGIPYAGGTGESGYPTTAEAVGTTHFTLDRLWIHPAIEAVEGVSQDVSAGVAVAFTGGPHTIKGSYISRFMGFESWSYSSTKANTLGINAGIGGPLLAEDNFIEAMFNNIFTLGTGIDPAHVATISSPSLSSITLSHVTGLQVGDPIAMEVTGGGGSVFSVNDAVTSGAGATTITSVIGGFTSAHVDMTMYFCPGSVLANCPTPTGQGPNFIEGGFRVLSVTNSNTLVLDASPTPSGAGSAGRALIGNCPYPYNDFAKKCYQSAYVSAIAGNVVSLTSSGAAFGRADVPMKCENALKNIQQCRLVKTPLAGATAQWRGVLPTDHTYRRNVIAKGSWWHQVPGAGPKAFIEVKSADNLTVESNIFVGACSLAMHLESTVSGANNLAPWSVIGPVMFRNNLLKTSVYGPGWVVGGNYEGPVLGPEDVTIENNLSMGIPKYCPPQGAPGEYGENSLVSLGPYNKTLKYRHNTLRLAIAPDIPGGDDLPPGWPGWFTARIIKPTNTFPSYTINMEWRDNLHDFGHFGIYLPYAGTVFDGLPGFNEHHNLINLRFPIQEGRNPAGADQFPNSCATGGCVANDAAIVFANIAACDSGADWTGCGLAPASPFKGQASDGTDPGVNIAALAAALGGTPAPPPPAGGRGRFNLRGVIP